MGGGGGGQEGRNQEVKGVRTLQEAKEEIAGSGMPKNAETGKSWQYYTTLPINLQYE